MNNQIKGTAALSLFWNGDYSYSAFTAALQQFRSYFSIHYLIREIPQILSQIHRPKLVLRHDIYFSPEKALKLAGLEKDAGFRGSFMFALDSPHFDLQDKFVSSILRELQNLSCEIGLLSASPSNGRQNRPDLNEVETKISREASKLEKILKAPVYTAAIAGSLPEFSSKSLFIAGKINASSPLMNKWTLSDEASGWNLQDLTAPSTEPYEALLQILIHPVLWGKEQLSRLE